MAARPLRQNRRIEADRPSSSWNGIANFPVTAGKEVEQFVSVDALTQGSSEALMTSGHQGVSR